MRKSSRERNIGQEILQGIKEIKLWQRGKRKLKTTTTKQVRKLSAKREKAIDDALNLQVISIRMQNELIQNLKKAAKLEGIGYQPLIRQILTRYICDFQLAK